LNAGHRADFGYVIKHVMCYRSRVNYAYVNKIVNVLNHSKWQDCYELRSDNYSDAFETLLLVKINMFYFHV